MNKLPPYHHAEVERRRDRTVAQGLYRVQPRKPRGLMVSHPRKDRFFFWMGVVILAVAAIAIERIIAA